MTTKRHFVFTVIIASLACALTTAETNENTQNVLDEPILHKALTPEISLKTAEQEATLKRIRSMSIEGNELISDEAILARVPFKPGDEFTPERTGAVIRNIYGMNYFARVAIEAEDIDAETIDLFIVVEEKPKVESIIFEGNDNLSQADIEEKLKISLIKTIDFDGALALAEKIKKLYAEKNFHNVAIEPKVSTTEDKTAKVVFCVTEGSQAVVKQVQFVGNTLVPSKKLRSLLVTKEDWILGFLEKAGLYAPEAIEYDKHVIGNFYQSQGFLAARVTNVDVDVDEESQHIKVTFHIEEGAIFHLRSVSAEPNPILTEEQQLSIVPIKPGQLYSRELIRQSIEFLQNTYGQFGYVNADVEPIVEPDFDEKSVAITFKTDLGEPVIVNRITIMGNTKTRDHVIRRVLAIDEGDILTTQAMEASKKRIETLGFFEPTPDGVCWRVRKIDKHLVDLDLLVKEVRTGKLYGQLGFGGADITSPSSSLKVVLSMLDRNLLGTGIRYNFSVTYSKEDRGLLLNVFQPWLLDRPVGAGFDIFHRRSIYEDFTNVLNVPAETLSGGSFQFTYAPTFCVNFVSFLTGGIERISYDNPIIVSPFGKTPEEVRLFQELIDRRFQPGDLSWVSLNLSQDVRNHPVFPNRGYHWNFVTKVGLPTGTTNFGYTKFDFDASWLTPLIREYDLFFLLHTHIGFIAPFPGRSVPYRELYHIGGPATVRGFSFGQIGPQLFGDSIGAKKAFWINAELISSIVPDQSIKVVLFYDGGAGWNTPGANSLNDLPLQNNRFKYRHSIGFGFRLTQPTPLRIDWGFKLDRNKRLGESISEVHFSMAQDF